MCDLNSNNDHQILLLSNPKTFLHFQIKIAECVMILGNILPLYIIHCQTKWLIYQKYLKLRSDLYPTNLQSLNTYGTKSYWLINKLKNTNEISVRQPVI